MAFQLLILTAVDIGEQVAEPQEDWDRIPCLRPENLHLALPKVPGGAQAVKNNTANADQQQHRYEDHDDIIEQQPVAHRQVAQFHTSHLLPKILCQGICGFFRFPDRYVSRIPCEASLFLPVISSWPSYGTSASRR